MNTEAIVVILIDSEHICIKIFSALYSFFNHKYTPFKSFKQYHENHNMTPKVYWLLDVVEITVQYHFCICLFQFTYENKV